jgi:AF2212-like
MTKTIEAVFDGETLRPDEPLELAPNTRVRLTIETPPSGVAPQSFLRTARSLDLSGPSDWSANLEAYLYGDR